MASYQSLIQDNPCHREDLKVNLANQLQVVQTLSNSHSAIVFQVLSQAALELLFMLAGYMLEVFNPT
jgi:hypothetical protein